MKSILSILTLVLILNISNSVAAIEGTCIQGNCNNGYGKINLLDGREIKCEVVNDEIQVDESTKQLWIKETNSEIEEFIVYLKIGDVYREHRNYSKSLEYYNKSLEFYPNYIEAINNNAKHFLRFCITKLKIVVSHVEFCEYKYNKIFIFPGCS